MLVSDSDSDRVGPWTKGYLRTTTDTTLTSMGLSGLAKLSCIPAQHTEMLVVLSSVVVR